MKAKYLGQLLMIGLEGPRLNKKERAFLRLVQPAGVIYFRRNIEGPRQLASLSKEIWKILGPTKPLIGIDQEGGRVARLGPPFTVFPGNDFLGRAYERTGKTDLTRAQAKAMATELKAVGVNLNFTPVADIDTNPRNPIIGRRSFGKTSKQVALLVAETIRAYNQVKVISCAKHYPGHGDTASDSHKVLPTARTSKATILRRDLEPFRSAVRANVPTIMTAHVIYPALDAKRPATLSPSILGMLRKQLGYKGVIISDDLEMSAIAAHRGLADAAIDALKAGVDLLLVCKSLEESASIYERLLRAAKDREIPLNQLETSVERILTMKSKFLGHPFQAKTLFTGSKRHEALAKRIGSIGA